MPALAQVNHQQRDRRGRDARDTRCQPQRFGPVLVQLLAHLEAQGLDLAVVEVGRQLQVLEVGGALHFVVLALDVAGVLGRDLDLLDLGSAQRRRRAVLAAVQRHQGFVVHVGPAQQVGQVVFVFDGLAQHPGRLGRRQVARVHPDRLEPLCFT
ncbi:hypothetical protein D3C72_1232690 [compost metagenome]